MAESMPRTILITGCNRGIGLELVKQLLLKPTPPEQIFATCRNPRCPPESGLMMVELLVYVWAAENSLKVNLDKLENLEELKKLSAKHPNLVLIKLEMTDSASIGKAAKDVEKQLKGRGLNLLINNAGIITDSTLESVNEKDLLHVYMTNMVGPMLVTKAFLPLLKKAAQAVREAEMNWHKAVLINISSITSSIEKVPETYSFFPALSYRCSKAALNMLTRCQSVVYKEDGILCTAIHPGWVKTDLGGPQAPLTVDESVHGILKVLCALSEKHNGILVDWEGNTIPW